MDRVDSAENVFAPEFGVVVKAFVSMDDLDPSGAMHNARYPLLFERAVIEHWVGRGRGSLTRCPAVPPPACATSEPERRYP